jgi:hypothetical protein
MKVELPTNSAATDDSGRVVGATHAARGTDDIARGNAPFAKPKKPVKPRVATHRRERSNISVNYAANSEMGQMSLAGW